MQTSVRHPSWISSKIIFHAEITSELWDCQMWRSEWPSYYKSGRFSLNFHFDRWIVTSGILAQILNVCDKFYENWLLLFENSQRESRTNERTNEPTNQPTNEHSWSQVRFSDACYNCSNTATKAVRLRQTDNARCTKHVLPRSNRQSASGRNIRLTITSIRTPRERKKNSGWGKHVEEWACTLTRATQSC